MVTERGFDELHIPTGYSVEAVFAVGKQADPTNLPEELRGREVPSDRRPLLELAFEGGFRRRTEETVTEQ